MRTTLSSEARFTALAEILYPIEAGMCLTKRQQQRTNRVVWVRRMLKDTSTLSESMLKKLLHELETKAGIEPSVHKDNEPVDGGV